MNKLKTTTSMLWLAAVVSLPATALPAKAQGSAGKVVFVAGTTYLMRASLEPQAIAKGVLLQQGDKLETHDTGYIYARMADGALLVLRPNSSLHIDHWQYDAARPELSQIKYTLDEGVARYVSGRGSQVAKEKFRFNTPLAAIGVRGTDFTVYANSQVTRVKVASGGVVVGAFDAGCAVTGIGPCEGSQASELFANLTHKMIEVSRQAQYPQLVDAPKNSVPDDKHPSRADEPHARNSGNSDNKGLALIANNDRMTTVSAVQEGGFLKQPSVPAQPFVSWGRWGQVDGRLDEVGVVESVLAGRTVVGMNRHYVLALNSGERVEMPKAGVANFALVSHEGVIMNSQTRSLDATTASNGRLTVDFGARRFQTSLDLAAGETKTNISARGSITNSGVMNSDRFVSPTAITGVIGGDKASQAAYIYRRGSEVGLEVSGVTHWSK